MEIKAYSDWKDEVKINPDDFEFELKCKKCKSKDIIIEAKDNLHMGSEYTGMYGDASAVIKCKECGNAYSILVLES